MKSLKTLPELGTQTEPMKREQGEKAFGAIAKAAGLSESQLAEAKKAGVNTKDPVAVAAYRATINTRSDSRNTPPRQPTGGESETMTVEDIELAITQKGLTPNEARALKTQLEGLKVAMGIRVQRNQLLSREECQEHQAETAHALKGFINALENEIPALCYGKSQGEAKVLVKEKIRGLQKILGDKFSEFWKGHPEL